MFKIITKLFQFKYTLQFAISPLREKCPNRELFSVLIPLYSVQIQENTDQK